MEVHVMFFYNVAETYTIDTEMDQERIPRELQTSD